MYANLECSTFHAHSYGIPHTQTYIDAYPFADDARLALANSDGLAYFRADRHAYNHWDINPHIHNYSYGVADSHAHQNADAKPHTHKHSDAHPHTDRYPDADLHAY